VAKQLTPEQAERKKSQASAFMERIGQPDRAQEFEEMSVDEYAEHKGLTLSNPRNIRKRSTIFMAKGNPETKADLQDQIDQAIDVLDDAYAPESSREDLAGALGTALDILRGDGEDADDGDADDGDDSDDSDDDLD
jgi:hypothetical protein